MQPLSNKRNDNNQTDIAACRRLLRCGSRTFYAASFLLPRHVREPASALYAFCRLADDAVDIDGGSLADIYELRERLDRAYVGRPCANPVDRAFAQTIDRFEIPRELPEALIAGLEWDASGRRYRELADLQAYAVRVAGTVGAMMAVLMQVRSPNLVAQACDLGIAMQLTNIARDVGEDARAQRVYLPLSWMAEAGIDVDDWLVNPSFSARLGAVVSRILDVADEFYARADTAIPELPLSCRPGIRAARLLYAEIGNQLRRHDCDSVSRRIVIPARRKLELLCSALLTLRPKLCELPTGCLYEAQFVVDATATSLPTPPAPATALPWWNLHGRAVRVIDIFEQIGRRELSSSSSGGQKQAIA
jgi:phytoene synthase